MSCSILNTASIIMMLLVCQWLKFNTDVVQLFDLAKFEGHPKVIYLCVYLIYTFSMTGVQPYNLYDRFEMNNYRMNEHAGTHIDAPTHFNMDGWDPSEIPLNRLYRLPAVVIDITERVEQDAHAQLIPGTIG